MNGYITVGDGRAEFTERKSRFIGSLAHAETEEQARAFVASVRAEMPDASHHVTCWVLRENNCIRFSDAGEPSGTAGRPALEVFTREGVTDLCFVATRYFGGILLGAGGLVRAYAATAKLALDAAGRAQMEPCLRFCTALSYPDWARLEQELRHRPLLTVEAADYAADVTVTFSAAPDETDAVRVLLRERTSGRSDGLVLEEFLRRVKITG